MTDNKPLPLHYNLVAGAIAGVSEILTMYPLDVVKTRFQIQVGNSEYKSIGDAFSKIVKTEGYIRLDLFFKFKMYIRFGALYRGILPPIFVEAPKRAIKFGANEQVIFLNFFRQIYVIFYSIKHFINLWDGKMVKLYLLQQV